MRNFSRHYLKTMMKMTAILSVVLYEHETWTFPLRAEYQLRVLKKQGDEKNVRTQEDWK
jgi:hypothetical protein